MNPPGKRKLRVDRPARLRTMKIMFVLVFALSALCFVSIQLVKIDLTCDWREMVHIDADYNDLTGDADLQPLTALTDIDEAVSQIVDMANRYFLRHELASFSPDRAFVNLDCIDDLCQLSRITFNDDGFNFQCPEKDWKYLGDSWTNNSVTVDLPSQSVSISKGVHHLQIQPVVNRVPPVIKSVQQSVISDLAHLGANSSLGYRISLYFESLSESDTLDLQVSVAVSADTSAEQSTQYLYTSTYSGPTNSFEVSLKRVQK